MRDKIIASYMGQKVHIVVDRPIGYLHGDILYPVNYGYIPGTVAGDGEEQDAYILGVSEPLDTFDGYIIGVDSANTIYATELGKWERTNFGTLGAEVMFEFYPGGYEVGDYYMMDVEFPALDMAFDYTTDTLYVLTDEFT